MRWQPECMVFPDNNDWLAYAPSSNLLFRANKTAAAQFEGLRDQMVEFDTQGEGPFLPYRVSAALSFACPNRCVYCFANPSHGRKELLELEFFRAVMDFVAENAMRKQRDVYLTFQGPSEPLAHWTLFCQCVEIAEQAASRHGRRTYLQLCTAGQVDEAKAGWVADRFDNVTVSFDGLPELQRIQRPRGDGRDPVPAPLDLIEQLCERGKRTTVNVVVTQSGVGRMVEMVRFLHKAHAGEVRLFRMETLPQVAEQAPSVKDFIEGFELALKEGERLGLPVEHGLVTREALGLTPALRPFDKIHVSPPHSILESYDFHGPSEDTSAPERGVWGGFGPDHNGMHFNLKLRTQALDGLVLDRCTACPLMPVCFAGCNLRERLPYAAGHSGEECEEKLLALKVLLRHMATPQQRPVTKSIQSNFNVGEPACV